MHLYSPEEKVTLYCNVKQLRSVLLHRQNILCSLHPWIILHSPRQLLYGLYFQSQLHSQHPIYLPEASTIPQFYFRTSTPTPMQSAPQAKTSTCHQQLSLQLFKPADHAETWPPDWQRKCFQPSKYQATIAKGGGGLGKTALNGKNLWQSIQFAYNIFHCSTWKQRQLPTGRCGMPLMRFAVRPTSFLLQRTRLVSCYMYLLCIYAIQLFCLHILYYCFVCVHYILLLISRYGQCDISHQQHLGNHWDSSSL